MKRPWLITIVISAALITAGAGTIRLLNPKTHEQRSNELRQNAYRLQLAGKMADAEQQYKSALAESRQGDNALQPTLVLDQLSQLYAAEHNDAAEEQTLRELLTVYQKLKETQIKGAEVRTEVNHGCIVTPMKLASVLQERGRNQEALPLYKVALAANPEDIGTIDQQLRLKSDYAALLKKLGLTEQAEQIETAVLLENEGYEWKDNMNQAKKEYLDGHYTEALKTFEFCRKKAKMIKDNGTLSLLDSWIAKSDLREGKSAEAERFLREAVQVRSAEPLYCAYYKVMLACALQRAGKLKEASQLIKQAYNVKHDFIVGSSAEILQEYDRMGMHKEAFAQSKWLLDQLRSIPGVRSTDITMLTIQAAEEGLAALQYSDAYPLIRNAIALHAPATYHVTLQSNLASCLDGLKRFKEAEAVWRKLLTEKLTDDELLDTMDHLAVNLAMQHRNAEAIAESDKRLAYTEQKFGISDRRMAHAFYAKASLYDQMAESAKAEVCWQQAIDAALKAKEKDASYINLLYYRLADNETHQLKLKQAEKTLKTKLAFCKTSLGEANRATIIAYFTLADNLRYQQKGKEEDACYQQALDVMKAHTLTDNTEYVDCLCLFGINGSTSEVKKNFCLQAIDAAKHNAPSDPQNLIRAHMALARDVYLLNDNDPEHAIVEAHNALSLLKQHPDATELRALECLNTIALAEHLTKQYQSSNLSCEQVLAGAKICKDHWAGLEASRAEMTRALNAYAQNDRVSSSTHFANALNELEKYKYKNTSPWLEVQYAEVKNALTRVQADDELVAWQNFRQKAARKFPAEADSNTH